ncbi:TMhelix containing protein [Vibrio phage 1.097.O._10N.286.49.B3]|uniref:TMhelix containing protein n=1 Tax=Vibrio phage 1.097.O._10N.286.49.B3 TaxID=1881383 RepID=A0A2I7R0K3_9CAUD|nr:TMhelix containing protein [Vibrio phage 1.097.O._10N.286.49.B3]AUR87172.1 TMhelix containing protein [Vibrio phage 1.097.O._10N.286.49.B3]
MERGGRKLSLFLYMGKYQHLTGSFATNLNSVDEPTSKSIVGKICLKPDYPHNNALLAHAYNGLSNRIHSVYNYARDEYTLGLPEGYGVYLNDTPVEDIRDAVVSDVGFDVLLREAFLSLPNSDIISRWYAAENWGWNSLTGAFTNPPLSSTDGDNDVTIIASEFDPEGDLRVTFAIGGNTNRVIRVSDHGFNLDELYYHVSYVPLNDTGVAEAYWFYRKGAGQHPDLDLPVEVVYGSPFMPVIPLRENNLSLGPECEDGEYVRDGNGDKIKPDTELYRTSVKLCKKARTDFDEITREISGNPDIDQIDHAYLIFGIDVRSDSPAGKHYLFQFFESVALETSGANEIVIKDSNFHCKVTFDDVVRTLHIGNLTKKTELTYAGNTLTLKRQINDTEYVQLVVTNLVHTNYVQDRHAVVTSLATSADEENFNFIIPLRFELIKQDRGMFEREDLIRESFKLVFNTYEKKKLKWYQRGIFKALITIVAIVVTVYTAGAGAAALATATAAEAVLLAAQAIIYSSLISLGFKMLARILPPEVFAILAVIAIVVAGSQAFGGTDFTSLTSQDLLQLSSNLVEITNYSIEAEMDTLLGEMTDFQDYASELEDELLLLEESLANEPLYDVGALLLHQPMFISGEEPENFYTRTIHAGNIGTQSLNVIESYVDSKLELPKQ